MSVDTDASAGVARLLQKARLELLDLSNRNRLLHTPRRSRFANSLEIADELSSEVFRLLVHEGRSLSFKAGRESRQQPLLDTTAIDDSEWTPLPQPDEDEEVDSRGVAARHSDTKLQTQLTSEGLQRRLLTLFYDAKSLIEEQGVNILYLALGMLRWFEAKSSEVERHAPIILLPVALERSSATERFHLRWTGDDPLPNLTLIAKMKAEFGLILPDFSYSDEFDIQEYFGSVAQVIIPQTRWSLQRDDMVVGFFSFAKFLMYRDLDPTIWPPEKPLLDHVGIRALLKEGFRETEPLLQEEAADEAVSRLSGDCFVLDADSSQCLAIEEVRRGRSLVIQGPPGTGKSQTIANVVADAVKRGQRVLFVAEKLAALEVVKRRLDIAGLDACCLELHSNKANKRSVLEELKRTLMLGHPIPPADTAVLSTLSKRRSDLNAHCARIGFRVTPSGETVFNHIGHLVRIQADGVPSVDIDMPEAVSWDTAAVAEREILLRDFAERMAQEGLPAEHPWVGVNREVILPTEVTPLVKRIQSAAEALEAWRSAVSSICSILELPVPEKLSDVIYVVSFGSAVCSAPPLDSGRILDPCWSEHQIVAALVTSGARWLSDSSELAHRVTTLAWSDDFASTRQVIANAGDSWSRWFSGDYRRAKRHLRELLKERIPKSHTAQLDLLDRLLLTRRLREEILASDNLGRSAFGTLWHGIDSHWPDLQRVVSWVESTGAQSKQIRTIVSRGPDGQRLQIAVESLQQRTTEFNQIVGSLLAELQADCQTVFGAPIPEQATISTISSRLRQWYGSVERLSRWTALNALRRKVESLGLAPFAKHLWTGTLPPSAALLAFNYARHASVLKSAFSQHPDLGLFDGSQHSNTAEQYRALDATTHSVARFETASAHWKNIPRGPGSVGPLGVLRTEVEKRRRHLPLRQLIKHAGPAIQALKPVFMMSPLSIAQFLEPGAVEFDLVLFDEASQVQPVDALGAIARARQLVVVGDDKQLPPTRFFARMTSAMPEEDDEEIAEGARDIESILGLCKARGLPQRMLRWHYRSRHQSLIAVSNRHFYENSLFIVPSPWTDAATMGLRFEFIRNGTFDSGGSATNRVEAKAVADAVMQHARKCPDLSLGVGTFSIRQKQAILDELELLRRRDPAVESFFTNHSHEPFFVKNLENIQGDERDVIFISIGYAQNSSGYMAMRFGPLSSDGGERRLNVLISRAKLCCRVFSSITADDIDLERGRGLGVAALKSFLSFAEKGIIDVGEVSGRDHDSPFEEEVARALRLRGYELRRQVGLAGFFIDLAVVHPTIRGRYVLGIECDGASYHSMKSVRDRDRLRQAVLEDHGWRIHRIWSLDWFQRPQEQLERTVAAIESAVTDCKHVESPETRRAVPINFATLERDASNEVKPLSTPYVEASFPVPNHVQPHEVGIGQMLEVVIRIVTVEGPIHTEEITARVRQLWGLARAGNRIQSAVTNAIEAALAHGRLRRADHFCSLPDGKVVVRDRTAVRSATLRRPGMLPPAEVDAAILNIIDAHRGAATTDLATQVPKILGFASSSSQWRTIVERQLTLLQEAGTVALKRGVWSGVAQV